MAIALTVAAVLALVDWTGVVRRDQRLRWVGKPGVMVALIVAALFSDGAPSAVKTAFVVALIFSLVGDVALLLPEDQWFIAGLVAFLVAHLAYITGMLQLDLEAPWGGVIVLVAIAAIGPRLLRSIRRKYPELLVPVIAYLVVISTMAITAWATGQPWLIVAAMLAFASDAVLGWNRFVTPRPADPATAGVLAPLAVMITYHAAQFCFVAWLITR